MHRHRSIHNQIHTHTLTHTYIHTQITNNGSSDTIKYSKRTHTFKFQEKENKAILSTSHAHVTEVGFVKLVNNLLFPHLSRLSSMEIPHSPSA